MSNIISLDDYRRRKREKEMHAIISAQPVIPPPPAPEALLNKQLDNFFRKLYDPVEARKNQELNRKIHNEQIKNRYKLDK